MTSFTPMRRIVVLALLLPAALALTPAAHAQAPYGNVVPVALPVPKGDEVVLARVSVEMRLRPARVAQSPLGALRVRRVGRLPRGFGVAAVRAGRRGDVVTVRLAAARTAARARRIRRLRLSLKIGDARVAFRRAVTSAVPIDPDTTVRRTGDCATISGEGSRWTPVGRLAAIRIGGERFGARTAVGAAQEIACEKDIRAVPEEAAARFLAAVHPAFGRGRGASIEGFFATWARGQDGRARVCVFVRGDAGATGDVTVGTTRQSFTLDDRGLARTQTDVPGEGRYLFTVRWRQPDDTFRESESTLRVPEGGTRGGEPPPPYSAAGPCT